MTLHSQHWLLLGSAAASNKVWGLRTINFPCGYNLPDISFASNGELLDISKNFKSFWIMGGLAFEVAKSGKNIPISEAAKYVAGFRPWLGTFNHHLLNDLEKKRHTITIWDQGVSIFYGMWRERCNSLGKLYSSNECTKILNKKAVLSYNKSEYAGETTNDYIHKPEKIIHFMSQFMTLTKGDIYILGPLVAESVTYSEIKKLSLSFGEINLSISTS